MKTFVGDEKVVSSSSQELRSLKSCQIEASAVAAALPNEILKSLRSLERYKKICLKGISEG